MPCHTVDIIIRNVAIQGLFSSDLVSLWCHISIVDSLRDNHQGSLFDLLQISILTNLDATTNYETSEFNEQKCVCHAF